MVVLMLLRAVSVITASAVVVTLGIGSRVVIGIRAQEIDLIATVSGGSFVVAMVTRIMVVMVRAMRRSIISRIIIKITSERQGGVARSASLGVGT